MFLLLVHMEAFLHTVLLPFQHPQAEADQGQCTTLLLLANWPSPLFISLVIPADSSAERLWSPRP